MVPTFPVCMNSFLISFCPFTVSSSSFRVFTFRVFKEFLRDFRCLLLDLELRNRGGGGGMRSWARRCTPRSRSKHVSQSLCLHWSALGEICHPPAPTPFKETKEGLGVSRCPLPWEKPTERKRTIEWKYGCAEGCQLTRWPTCDWVFDEGCSLFLWLRRPHPQGFPPHWASAHSHHHLQCPHWLGDTSKVREMVT